VITVSIQLRRRNITAAVAEAVVAAIGATMQKTAAVWARSASTALRSTYIDYVNGLAQDGSMEAPHETGSGFAGAVVLVGEWPNKLERGFPPYDIKVGLLRGAAQGGKVYRTKDGAAYNIVPFRHRMSGSGAAVGGSLMPPSVARAARRLSGRGAIQEDRVTIGGYTTRGARGRIARTPVGFGQRTQLPTGGMDAPYTWKNSPFAGMVRVQRQYEKARQSQYLTFRCVSEPRVDPKTGERKGSDPNSWWHPGFKGVHLAPVAAREAKDVLTRAVQRELKARGL